MNLLLLFLLPSLMAIFSLPWIVERKIAGMMSACLASASFLFAIFLIGGAYRNFEPIFFLHHWMMCDKLSAFFIAINSFITMTTSFYAISYFHNENKTALYPLSYRFYNTFFHLFTLAMSVVILSNHIALMWIAMEMATMASVILIALYQSKTALEAAWKYLILCGVGIGLALLGTVIIYFAAKHHVDQNEAFLWTTLIKHASQLSPTLLSIAFVFLLVGYGTKVGFFPLHNWLPDAHSEAPSPISALLSGLLLNVALFAIVRFKFILQKTVLAAFSSHLFLLFGFSTLLFSALSLLRQRKLKRLLAYSSMEHMGLITIAFGIGTPLAYLSALLHLVMHSLTKTAAFFASGNIIQRFHTQTISQLKGLCETIPIVGWCLLLSAFALMGLPPSGLFFSELLLFFALLKSNAWLIIPFILSLSIAFVAVFSKFQRLAFSAQPVLNQPLKDTRQLTWPVCLHLFLVILAGFFIPMGLLQPVIHFLMSL